MVVAGQGRKCSGRGGGQLLDDIQQVVVLIADPPRFCLAVAAAGGDLVGVASGEILAVARHGGAEIAPGTQLDVVFCEHVQGTTFHVFDAAHLFGAVLLDLAQLIEHPG